MSVALDRVTRRVGGETHIHETSFELAPGSLNVLLGPTLAGKTTLLRLLAGLDRPSSGRVIVDGRDVTGVAVRRRDVAMVYQQFINYPSFTVRENIAAPLRRAGVGRAEREHRVREVAEMLHIEDLLGRLPGELSGGQQQRTALARALVKDAALLLLDEPLVNLDYKLREALRQELRAVFAERQSVVVYATTEPLEALLLGGDTLVVDAGRVLQHGPTVELYRRPASERVGEIFSDPPINLVDGDLEGGELVIAATLRAPRAAHMRALPDGPCRFGVRAHDLYVARRHGDDLAIDGEVEIAEISGSETFIHVAHNGTSWVVQEEGVHGFALGERTTFYVSPEALFVFARDGHLIAAPERRAGGGGDG